MVNDSKISLFIQRSEMYFSAIIKIRTLLFDLSFLLLVGQPITLLLYTLAVYYLHPLHVRMNSK